MAGLDRVNTYLAELRTFFITIPHLFDEGFSLDGVSALKL